MHCLNLYAFVLEFPKVYFSSRSMVLTFDLLHLQASNDQSVLDLELAGRLGWCGFSIIQILGTIGVMSQVAWQVFVIFIPVTGICIWYQVREFTFSKNYKNSKFNHFPRINFDPMCDYCSNTTYQQLENWRAWLRYKELQSSTTLQNR